MAPTVQRLMDGIGEKIRKARKAAGLTQKAVAKEFDIERVSVTQWENGQTHPTIDKIPRLAKLLGLSEEELLSDAHLERVEESSSRAQKVSELVTLIPQLRDDVLDALLSRAKAMKERGR